MNEYQLVLDAWGEQAISDMQTLKDNGVKAVLLRLNDINGGHHMDEGFWPQWDAAGRVGMLRAPYFVYNPWVSGAQNYAWLSAHVPDCKLVMADVEVAKPDYPRSAYANELKSFISLIDARWNRMIYTGEWFLPLVSGWPGGNYCWAAYPFSLYPGSAQVWSYDQLRAVMDTLTVPVNQGAIPGILKMWQCSGDRLILPGSGGHPIDVDLFRGSYAELQAFFGETVIPVTPTAYVLKLPRAEYDLCVTPGSGSLPLLSAVEHAAANGWECAMNGGAGFRYDDASHATPLTSGFQHALASDGSLIYYANRAITGGVVNEALPDDEVGPWCFLALDAESYYLVTTYGLEGSAGMTKLQAARYVLSLGATDAYIEDSGRSAQIEDQGTMLFWPYGPSEKVPVCIGLKRKSINGGTMSSSKGVVNPGYIANIKELATGVIKHKATAGEYVYGDLSSAGTDLIGFTHYYNTAGGRVELGAVCKVSIGANLTVTPEAEPTEPPPATTDATIIGATVHLSDGTDVELVVK